MKTTCFPLSRRRLVVALGSLGLLATRATAASNAGESSASRTLVEVWKDPSCGCCKDWIVHMEAHGFIVTVHETGRSATRARLGLPANLGACHTALAGGYLIEGHVPASDVRALLRAKPIALGLTVPGMPVGAPGMDGPAYGQRRDPYDVLLVDKSGHTTVFRSYHRKEAA